MPALKIGFFVMVIVVGVVSYYCTNLVNPLPTKSDTANKAYEISGSREVATIVDKSEEDKKLKNKISPKK